MMLFNVLFKQKQKIQSVAIGMQLVLIPQRKQKIHYGPVGLWYRNIWKRWCVFFQNMV